MEFLAILVSIVGAVAALAIKDRTAFDRLSRATLWPISVALLFLCGMHAALLLPMSARAINALTIATVLLASYTLALHLAARIFRDERE